nr:hypothetical protein [Tanacetum cinerariifolium]
MSNQQAINASRAQRLANTHDPLALMPNTQTPFHPDQSSHITYIQHPQPNNNFVQQPSFNMIYMLQPMQSPKDSSDPTTAMNMTLALLVKAFKVNTIPTNNNKRSSLIPHNSIQIVENMKGLSVVSEIADQYENGNVVTAPIEGNGNGNGFNERVKVNCTSENTFQQASTSVTQSDNTPVYDSNGSAEIKWLQAQLGDLKGKSSDTQCASNTLDPLPQKLEDEIVSLESQVLNYAKENAHLKTTYKNLFDSIKVTQAQTNSIIDSLQKQLYDTIYENAKLRAQLFDKVYEQKGSIKVVQTVNVIAPRIFRTNPSKTSRVDNVVPNKSVKTSVRIKPITVSQPNVIHKQQANSDLNGFSSTRVNNTTKTRRPHSRSNSNTGRVPSMSKSSCLSNNIKKIEENHRNSQIPKNQKHMSSECNNITLAIQKAKSKIVYVMCKQCLVTANHDVCMLNYVNDINSHADNQSANVSMRENQKTHKANAKNSKELWSKGSLASFRPSKPRTYLRWIPSRIIFAMCGKLTASSNTKNKSENLCVTMQILTDLPRNTPLDRVEVLGMIEKGIIHQNGYANVAWLIARWMKRKGDSNQREIMICCEQFIMKITKKARVLSGEGAYSPPGYDQQYYD